MVGRPVDVELAYETLASAAADPLIRGFDIDDLKIVERAAESVPGHWLTAAALFFEFRERRAREGENGLAREVFLRSLRSLEREGSQ